MTLLLVSLHENKAEILEDMPNRVNENQNILENMTKKQLKARLVSIKHKSHFNYLFIRLLALHLTCYLLLQHVDCNAGEDEEEMQESSLMLEDSYKKIGENLVEKLGDTVKGALEPAKNYYNLVNRYHSWFKRYKKLERASKGRTMKDASEVLKEEYARVDRILFEEECSTDFKDISNSPTEPANYAKKVESVDFVFKVLRKVIDRLEVSLDKLEEETGDPKFKGCLNSGLKILLENNNVISNVGEEEEEEQMPEVDEEQVKLAMIRVKKTVLKAATDVATNEALTLANLLLVSKTVKWMSSLSYLTPFVSLMGKANTPLTVWYLRNLELRAGLAIVSQLNPLSFLSCAFKDQNSDRKTSDKKIISKL